MQQLLLITLIAIVSLHHSVGHQVGTKISFYHDSSLPEAVRLAAKSGELSQTLYDIGTAAEEAYHDSRRLLSQSKSAQRTLISSLKRQYDEADGDNTCYNHTMYLFERMIILEKWTVQFLDSYGKLPSAVTYGALSWLGSMDQCMNASDILVSGDHFSTPNIHGQYCLVPILPPGGAKKELFGATPLKIGVCFPDSCNSQQVGNITRSIVNTLQSLIGISHNNSSFTVLADKVSCKQHITQLPWTPQAIVMMVIISIFASLMISATVYDIWLEQTKLSIEQIETEQINSDTAPIIPVPQLANRKHGIFVKILLCFSVYTNASKLLDVSHQEGTLTCIHGIRFLSMSWVILGHTYYFAFSNMANLGQLLNHWEHDWTYQVIANATVSVDTFFVLSGLLSTFLFFRELTKLGGQMKRVNWLMFYIHRYWRLTPPYLLVMGTYVTLFQYWYNGPLYPQEAGGIDPACTNYWWRNALYINNFFDVKDGQCMGWSWYLANDMQFYIISPLLFAGLVLKPAIGLGVISGIILVSVTVLGIYNTNNKITAGFFGLVNEFDGVYIKPWFRIPAYLVGMVGGYIIHRISLQRKDTKFKLPWFVNLGCWAIAAALCLTVIYSLYEVNGGAYISQEASSLYNCLYRVAWALGVTWVIFACVTGNGGWVNRLLSIPIFAPLSRLTYCAYLVHPVIIMLFTMTRQQTLVWDNFTVIYNFLGNCIMAYMAAFVASLAFESPLIGLEKVLRSL